MHFERWKQTLTDTHPWLEERQAKIVWRICAQRNAIALHQTAQSTDSKRIRRKFRFGYLQLESASIHIFRCTQKWRHKTEMHIRSQRRRWLLSLSPHACKFRVCAIIVQRAHHIVTIYPSVYVKNELANSTFYLQKKANKQRKQIKCGSKWDTSCDKSWKFSEKWDEVETRLQEEGERSKTKTNTYFTAAVMRYNMQPSFGLFWILKWYGAKIISTTSSLAPITENNFKSLCMLLFYVFFSSNERVIECALLHSATTTLWLCIVQPKHTHARTHEHNSNEQQWQWHAKEPFRHLFNATFSPLYTNTWLLQCGMWSDGDNKCGRDITLDVCVQVDFFLLDVNRDWKENEKEGKSTAHKNQSTKMQTHIYHRFGADSKAHSHSHTCMWYGICCTKFYITNRSNTKFQSTKIHNSTWMCVCVHLFILWFLLFSFLNCISTWNEDTFKFSCALFVFLSFFQ